MDALIVLWIIGSAFAAGAVKAGEMFSDKKEPPVPVLVFWVCVILSWVTIGFMFGALATYYENNNSRRPACPAEKPQGGGPAAADGQDV